MQNTVHFILQGKGGIGKTLVSTLLAQWIGGKDDTALRCYDTDQENATFSRYKAMNVKHVPVMTDARNIDPKRFDALMIDILEEEGNCVVDNGANTFSPLMGYLLENDCFSLLEESGRKVYIHTIVGGGDTLHDTAAELGALIAHAMVGTFLGILLAYGFISPLASVLRQKSAENAKMMQCIKVTLLSSINGYAPQIAVEFGRKTLYTSERPSFIELEEHVRQVKSPGQKQTEEEKV